MESDRVDRGEVRLLRQTLRNWVRQAERDRGLERGSTTQEQERIRELERENRELRQVNEILRKASAYFAQAELDRRPKKSSHGLIDDHHALYRSRADLPGDADRSVDVLHACVAPGRPGTAAGASPARRRPVR